jgi:glutathione S-transferase
VDADGVHDLHREGHRARARADRYGSSARRAGADGLVGAGSFLVGETLTLADLYLAPQVSNCREKAPELLDGLVTLAAWADRMAARDSFRQTSYDPAAL